jgi:hypothetical protein
VNPKVHLLEDPKIFPVNPKTHGWPRFRSTIPKDPRPVSWPVPEHPVSLLLRVRPCDSLARLSPLRSSLVRRFRVSPSA